MSGGGLPDLSCSSKDKEQLPLQVCEPHVCKPAQHQALRLSTCHSHRRGSAISDHWAAPVWGVMHTPVIPPLSESRAVQGECPAKVTLD